MPFTMGDTGSSAAAVVAAARPGPTQGSPVSSAGMVEGKYLGRNGSRQCQPGLHGAVGPHAHASGQAEGPLHTSLPNQPDSPL